MTTVEILNETSLWRSREVKYLSGSWLDIKEQMPEFALKDFGDSEVEGEGVNPFYKTVYRLPRNRIEKEVPIGLVSQSYTLAQHQEVGQLCMEGFEKADIDISTLRCELGLSEFGEWMNFRVYFPDTYNYRASDREDLNLRLECFNSVDGSSRLVIVLGWLRFVCSNGMIISETMEQLRDVHNKHMNLDRIPIMIGKAMQKIKKEKARLERWGKEEVTESQITQWVDEVLADKWGKKAACRAYHICLSGRDVESADLFEGGPSTKKSVIKLDPVPGSPSTSKNLYDVCQALSWLATQRNSAEQKVEWQTQVPSLLDKLSKTDGAIKDPKLGQVDLFSL